MLDKLISVVIQADLLMNLLMETSTITSNSSSLVLTLVFLELFNNISLTCLAIQARFFFD